NARYRASDEGREDHRDRQRAYLERRRAMTYMGSAKGARGEQGGAASAAAPTGGTRVHAAAKVANAHDDSPNSFDGQCDANLGARSERQRDPEGASSAAWTCAPPGSADVARSDRALPVAIDKPAFARFDTNLYSAPPAYAGETLTLVADDR